MEFDVAAAVEFWDSVDIDERIVEKIYCMIVMGVDKDSVLLMGDEGRVWDFVAESVKNNPIPKGSIYEVPSWN